MKIVLRVHSSHEDYDADCRCAVIDVTEELLQSVRRRVEFTRQARQADPDLWEMYFWSSRPRFYGYALVEACDRLANTRQGAWEADFDQRGMAILPEGVRLEDFQPQRTECDQEIVRHQAGSGDTEFEIAWTASPKHTNLYVTTEAVSREQWEALAHGVESPEAYPTSVMLPPSPRAASVGAGEGRQTGPRVELPCYGIVLELGPEDPSRSGAYQGGKITSGLAREDGLPEFNAAMETVESLLLAHAVAGIDVASGAYAEGIETAMKACRKHRDEPQGSPFSQKVARLLEKAEEMGLQAEQLDDLVHDAAGQEASGVNNGGLSDQVEYLVRHWGIQETEQALAQFWKTSGQKEEPR
jgi:hypothetical protein